MDEFLNSVYDTIGTVMLVLLTEVARAEDVGIVLPDQLPWWGEVLKYALSYLPDVNGWLAVVFVSTMAVLRGLAEFFNFIAAKTESKFDDKIAQNLTIGLRFVSKVVGWFGLGKPKG